jgi:hypothetical protein
MALLPSPSKGAPDSPPLSSTTMAGKMYINVRIVFFISYIFVLLQQEEDGAVAITLERHA